MKKNIMKEIETLKQQFDILQTTILPKEELEDTMVTTNIDEWIEFIENCETDPLTPSEYICDYTIVKNAKAFALAPVFCYKGKAETTGTRLFNSLKEMKEFLKDKNYILYVIHRIMVGFVQEDLTPDISKASEVRFTFRGHILE